MPAPRDTIFVAKFHTRCQAFVDTDAGGKARCQQAIAPDDLVFIPSGRGYVQHAYHAPEWVWEKREQLDALFALVQNSEIKRHHHSVKRWASAAIDYVKRGDLLDAH